MTEHLLTLNPLNPGHFFACCGLLEISSLLDTASTAHFSNHGRQFHLTTAATLPAALRLSENSDLDGKPYDKTLEELHLFIAANPVLLTINWWLQDNQTGKTSFKTWGGQQTPRAMLTELLSLAPIDIPAANLLRHTCYSTTRFGIDCDTAWNSFDVGYSPNDSDRKETVTFPWVEVLAVVGLQGFRPSKDPKDRHYHYAAWELPLPIVAARGAAVAPWPGLAASRFAFKMAGRGQSYRTFSTAKEITNV